MHQRTYIERLLTDFVMMYCNPLSIPIKAGWSFGNSFESEGNTNTEKFWEICYI